jgi:hypothetical protein
MYGLAGPSDTEKGKSVAAQAPVVQATQDLHDDEDDFGLDREEDEEQELQQRVSPPCPEPLM